MLERCLTKDAKARLRDIGEARHTLDELISGKTSPKSAHAPAGAARRSAVAWLPWTIAAAFAVLAGVAWLTPADRRGNASRLVRVELSLPGDVEFYASPRISPDGRRVAFVGVREGIRQMYIRDLAQAETRPVNGTESAISIAFSPDSASAGVITTDGRLKRVTLGTGSVEELATGIDIAGGMSWSSDGKLLFGQVTRLVFMPATGGPVKEIVAADTAAGETSLVNPVPTPDGKHVLFTSWAGAAGALRPRVEVVSINGGDRRVVMEDAGYVVAARSDRLLFQRGDAIYSVPFDAVQAAVNGVPTRLTDEATSNPIGGLAADLTASGDLLFAEARLFNGRLVWVSHEGIERVLPVPARAYANPRVSPDGRTVAYSESASIWTADVERGAQTRIFVGSDGVTGFATWAADGVHLFFRSASGVSRVRADGEGKPDLLPGTVRQDYPNSVSPDGKWLGMTRILSITSGDVVLLPLGGGDARVVVGTNAYEGGVQFSPDGRWLAYVSNSSGRMEVYLRSIEGADRYPVSTTGGLHPLWSRDGRQIYFRNGQQMLAVNVTTSPAVHLSAPKLIFERRYAFGPNLTIANYGLSKDGREFLMVREDGGGSHLSLIFNWLGDGGR